MKKLLFLGLLAFSFNAYAVTYIDLTPDMAIDFGGVDTDVNISDYIESTYNVTEGYRSSVTGVYSNCHQYGCSRWATQIENGTYVNSYDTRFNEFNGSSLSGAQITYTPDGDTFSDPSIYLLAQGVNTVNTITENPAWYLFDISEWDGLEKLYVHRLWTAINDVNEQYGDLRQVAIFSGEGTREVSPVPLPPAVWLFGAGLLGLVSVARRKSNV